MIIEKLRAGTKQTHEELEKEMLPFIRDIRLTDDYARLLLLFYGYYKPLEDSVLRYVDSSVLPDLEHRRKTNWILNDLAVMGHPSADIALDQQAPTINSAAEAMGALYVMEGSSLGGKVICKMIAENLGKPDQSGLSFFYGYGPETGSRWKAFLSVLDTYSGGNDEDLIVAKATEVFSGFRNWLRKNNS